MRKRVPVHPPAYPDGSKVDSLTVSLPITLKDLARAMKVKPFKLIHLLMEEGHLGTLSRYLTASEIETVCGRLQIAVTIANHWQPPSFSREAWYSDVSDSRCPHDSELECINIHQSNADRSDSATITLKLLSAKQDGWIVLIYSGVQRHDLPAYLCDQGSGKWLRDDFSPSENGLIQHRIVWHSSTSHAARAIVIAQDIKFEWRARSD